MSFHDELMALEGDELRQTMLTMGMVRPDHMNPFQEQGYQLRERLDNAVELYGEDEQVVLYCMPGQRVMAFDDALVKRGVVGEDDERRYGHGLQLLSEGYPLPDVTDALFNRKYEPAIGQFEKIVDGDGRIPEQYRDPLEAIAADHYHVEEDEELAYHRRAMDYLVDK